MEELIELVFVEYYSNRVLRGVFWVIDVIQVSVLVIVIVCVDLSDPCAGRRLGSFCSAALSSHWCDVFFDEPAIV
jgi:hypothetical protein